MENLEKSSGKESDNKTEKSLEVARGLKGLREKMKERREEIKASTEEKKLRLREQIEEVAGRIKRKKKDMKKKRKELNLETDKKRVTMKAGVVIRRIARSEGLTRLSIEEKVDIAVANFLEDKEVTDEISEEILKNIGMMAVGDVGSNEKSLDIDAVFPKWKEEDFKQFLELVEYHFILDNNTDRVATESKLGKAEFLDMVERFASGEKLDKKEEEMLISKLSKEDWASIFNNLKLKDKVITLLTPSQNYAALKNLNDYIFGMLGTDLVIENRLNFSEDEFAKLLNKNLGAEMKKVLESFDVKNVEGLVGDLNLEQSFKYGIFKMPENLERAIANAAVQDAEKEAKKNLETLSKGDKESIREKALYNFTNKLCESVDHRMTYEVTNMLSSRFIDKGILGKKSLFKDEKGNIRIPEFKELKDMKDVVKSKTFKKLIGFIEDIEREGFRMDFGIASVKGNENNEVTAKEQVVAVSQAMQMSLAQASKWQKQGAPKLEGIDIFENKSELNPIVKILKKQEKGNELTREETKIISSIGEEKMKVAQSYKEYGEEYFDDLARKEREQKISYGMEYDDKAENMKEHIKEFKALQAEIYGNGNNIKDDTGRVWKIFNDKNAPKLKIDYGLLASVRKGGLEPAKGQRTLLTKLVRYYKLINVWDMVKPFDSKEVSEEDEVITDDRGKIKSITARARETSDLVDKLKSGKYNPETIKNIKEKIIGHEKDSAKFYSKDYFETVYAPEMGDRILLSLDVLNAAPMQIVDDFEEKMNEAYEAMMDDKMTEEKFKELMDKMSIESGDLLTKELRKARDKIYQICKKARLLDNMGRVPGTTQGDEFFTAFSMENLDKAGMLDKNGKTNKRFEDLLFDIQTAANVRIATSVVDTRAVTRKGRIQEQDIAMQRTEDVIDKEKEIEQLVDRLKDDINKMFESSEEEQSKLEELVSTLGVQNIYGYKKESGVWFKTEETRESISYIEVIDKINMFSINLAKEYLISKKKIKKGDEMAFFGWCYDDIGKCSGSITEIVERWFGEEHGGRSETRQIEDL